MGLSFRKSFHLGSIRLTASKGGVSASAGPRGATLSASTRGAVRASARRGGLFWRKPLRLARGTEQYVRLVLVPLERDGVVVHAPEEWRLTDAAEARYGQALRDWELGESSQAAA